MERVKKLLTAGSIQDQCHLLRLHYPFENKELFEQNYPAQFISEAVDQTRGWFYTLLAISTACI